MSRVREISIKNCTYYLFNDIINFKNLDPNNFKIDKKSYKNILIYYIGYVAPNSLKPLYLIINNTNGYIGESNGNKYLTLLPTDEVEVVYLSGKE